MSESIEAFLRTEKPWDEFEQPESITLPPQLSIQAERPDPAKIVGPVDEVFWKPAGGLWTSTETETGGEWLEWLTGEGYNLSMPRWGGKLWRLVPREAKVFVVWSPKHLRDLVAMYPHSFTREHPRLTSFRTLVDWRAMAQDYDGVHVPSPWPWRFGLEDYEASMFFYTFDAESTCWFRWCFEGEPEELDPEPFLAKIKEERNG